MEFRLSATRGGAAIDASLSKPAQEGTETLGRYYAVFDVANLVAHLAALGDAANLERRCGR